MQSPLLLAWLVPSSLFLLLFSNHAHENNDTWLFSGMMSVSLQNGVSKRIILFNWRVSRIISSLFFCSIWNLFSSLVQLLWCRSSQYESDYKQWILLSIFFLPTLCGQNVIPFYHFIFPITTLPVANIFF